MSETIFRKKKGKQPANPTANLAAGPSSSNTTPVGITELVSQGGTPSRPTTSLGGHTSSGFRASARRIRDRATNFKDKVKAVSLFKTSPPMDSANEGTSTANQSEVHEDGAVVEAPAIIQQDMRSTRVVLPQQKNIVDPETLKKFLDLGNKVAGVAGEVSKVVPGVSNVVGTALKLVADFIGAIKKMVENREAWQKLIEEVDEHQRVFNEQLERIKVADEVPDPESPLLGPIKQYASALESLMKDILDQSNIRLEEEPDLSSMAKLAQWSKQFLFAEMDKDDIDGHAKKFSNAIEQLKLALAIFTGFTVDSVKGTVQSIGDNVDSIKAELRTVGSNVEGIHKTLIHSIEPKDTINARHITALGGQHSTCLPGTRVDVLEELRQWARDQRVESPIYCIRDVAGTGKSTIARTIVEEWGPSGRLAFFFSQEDSSVRNVSDFCFFVKTQIQAYCHSVQLGEYWKSLSTAALELLRSESIEQQWKRLVYEPLCRIPKDQPRILVIDALDECTVPTRGSLLKCVLEACSSGSLPHIRVLLTTRNEEDLRLILDRDQHRGMIKSKTLLQSVNTDADVARYVNYRLDQSKLLISSHEQRNSLITRCGGLFIFASLACGLLEDAGTEDGPLNEILEGFTSLDSLYHEVLKRADRKPEYTRPALQGILGIILVAREPLSVASIADLLCMPVEGVEKLVGRLGSVLSISTAQKPIAILHATFSEFLVRRKRNTLGGERVVNEYAVCKPQSNRLVAQGCLSILLRDVKRNPCNLPSDYGEGTAASYISRRVENRIQRSTTAALRYAASAWIAHIIPDLHIQQIIDDVRKIFHEKVLNWIELAALLRRLPDCMSGVHSLQEALSSTLRLSNCAVREDDVQWCRDILEFMQSNQDLLSHHPLHVYSSALTFTPRQSQIYQVYAHTSLPKIVLGHPTRTSGTLMLMGHRNPVYAVTYSAGGELLVSAAYGGEVVVWDARTGARQWDYKLEGEEGECRGVRVLPGSRVIVSMWMNDYMERQKYTRLYRLSCETKGLLCPAENLDISSESSCISWAPDLNQFACGTDDGIVHLFTLGGQLQGISSIEAHEGRVASLSFAHDGITMASASYDGVIKIWSVTTEGLTGPTAVWKHTEDVQNGAFSPVDSSLFAFVDDDSLHLYNISTNSIDFRFYCGYNAAGGMAYSHDGKQIAVRDRWKSSVHVINTVDMDKNSTPMTREIDTGHTGGINCFTFSPDDQYLVTGSDDFSLRIHDLASTAPQTTATGHQYMVSSLSFSLDGRWLASVDDMGNICIWNVESGTLIQDTIQTGMKFSKVAMSSDESIVTCASQTNDIRFWSMSSEREIGAKVSLEYPKGVRVESMVFSPDDTKLAMTTEKCQIVLIDVQNTHALSTQPFFTINLDFYPGGMILAFHPSGDYICCGDRAWGVTSSNPNSLTSDQLGTILKETFPLLRFDKHASPSPSISLGSQTRQVFYTPPDFGVRTRATHDGRIALGARDGRVMVIDFTHLATEEEQVLLDRIKTIRRETATLLFSEVFGHTRWFTLRSLL